MSDKPEGVESEQVLGGLSEKPEAESGGEPPPAKEAVSSEAEGAQAAEGQDEETKKTEGD